MIREEPMMERSKSPRRITLFEPTIEGHRARYCGEIVRGIRQKHPGCELRLCIYDSEKLTPGYREFLQPLEREFHYCPLPEDRSSGRFVGEWVRLKLLKQILDRFPCDDLIIPYGDGLVPLMGALPEWILRKYLPGNPRIESMLFRPEWVYPKSSVLQGFYHRVRRWAVCRWPGDRLHFSDYSAWRRSAEGIDSYKAQVSLMPEVFDDWNLSDRQTATQWLTREGILTASQSESLQGTQIVAAPGLPSLRKGTVELIQAFCLAKQLPGNLMIWGPIPEDVSEELNARQVRWQLDSRIIVVDRYVCEGAFRAMLSIADLVVLPYQSHLGGVSSLFLLAAIFRLKTICDRRGWLGWAASHYDHGLAIDSSDVALLSRSLESTLLGKGVPIISQQQAGQLRSETMEGGFRGKWC
jgi:glycosyltransferase involved in cell wall biosynthesis